MAGRLWPDVLIGIALGILLTWLILIATVAVGHAKSSTDGSVP